MQMKDKSNSKLITGPNFIILADDKIIHQDGEITWSKIEQEKHQDL